VFKSVIVDFAIVLVPNFYPHVIAKWILFVTFYLIVGFLITVNEGKKVKKDLNID
jgi:hypothetical protein